MTDQREGIGVPERPLDAGHGRSVCEAFASAWQSGQNPSLEVFLAGSTPADPISTFRELLVIEVTQRRSRGE